jgi:uncharacterized surface anchored protein
VTIIKHTDPRGIDQNFSYTSTLAGSNITCTTDSTPDTFTLNDSGNTSGDSAANTEDCTNVPVGSYTVTEGAEPNGFVLESLTCTAGGEQDATIPEQANITVTADSHVTCTYTNQQQLGAIKITKTSIKAAATPLSGATFSITGPNSYSNSVTTGDDGTVCVDGLAFGTYSITETAAPPGYSIDDTSAHNVAVNTSASCGSGNETTFSATDTPLTDISASATSEVPGGTESTISCVDSSNADVGDSPQGPAESPTVSATGLAPGTYTCTIVIDP